MEKQKKTFFAIITVIEVLLVAGCFVFNYFTVNKLGMVRWVNFHSMKWEKAYPILPIKIIVIAALLICTALLLWIYIKRRHSTRKLAGFMAAGSVILSLASVGYILFVSPETMRAYYFICVMLAAAAVMQLVKTAAGLIILRKKDPDPAV